MHSYGLSPAKEALSDDRWSTMAISADQPVPVVVVLEHAQRLVEFLDAGEGPDPEELLLEGAPEPLDPTVPLWGVDMG